MIQVTINDISNIDSLQQLTAAISDDGHSILLKWRPIENVDGYTIETVLPQPYPKVELRKTDKSELKIENLAGGIQYIFRVSPYVKHFTGRPQAIKVTLSGEPLPEISNISLENDSNLARLRWKVPKTDLKNITYGIYYGTSESELFERKLNNSV